MQANFPHVIDNALPAELFAELSLKVQTGESSCGYDEGVGCNSIHTSREFKESEVAACVRDLVSSVVGNVEFIGAYYVLTEKGDPGSGPHFDEFGPTAILHLADEWRPEYGGEFFVLEEDQKTVRATIEYKPNRLAIITEDCCHRHNAPVADKQRFTLVSRFVLRP